MAKRKVHICNNFYAGEGAAGACFVQVEDGEKPQHVRIMVGHSCVIALDDEIPITWLAEVIAIAASHKGGIEGFLHDGGFTSPHFGGSNSYALQCDPAHSDLCGKGGFCPRCGTPP